MADLNKVLSDPNFHGLPFEEQKKVVGKLDPNFSGLPDMEQTKALRTMLSARGIGVSAQKTPVTPLTQPAPAFMSDEGLGGKITGAINDYAVAPLEAVAKAGSDFGKGFMRQSEFDPYIAAKTGQLVPSEKLSPAHQGVNDAIGSITGGAIADPRNWPFLGAGGASVAMRRAIAGGFAGMMAKGAVDQAGQFGAVMDSPDTKEKYNLGTQAVLSTAMAAMAGHGMAEKAPPPPTASLADMHIDTNAPELQHNLPQPLDVNDYIAKKRLSDQVAAKTQKPLPTSRAAGTNWPSPESPSDFYSRKAPDSMSVMKGAEPFNISNGLTNFDLPNQADTPLSKQTRVSKPLQAPPEPSSTSTIASPLPTPPEAAQPQETLLQTTPPVAQPNVPVDRRQGGRVPGITVPESVAPTSQFVDPATRAVLQQKLKDAVLTPDQIRGNTPPTFTTGNKPGANYTSDQLAEFKAKHGITDEPRQMVGEPKPPAGASSPDATKTSPDPSVTSHKNYPYYKARLENPELLDKAVPLPGGDLAVPVGGKRRSGDVMVPNGKLDEALSRLRQMPDRFPNAAVNWRQEKASQITFGEPVRWEEENPDDWRRIGQALGYTKESTEAQLKKAYPTEATATSGTKAPAVKPADPVTKPEPKPDTELVTNVVDMLRKGKTLSGKGLEAVEAMTGKTLKGKNPQNIAHDLANWLQVETAKNFIAEPIVQPKVNIVAHELTYSDALELSKRVGGRIETSSGAGGDFERFQVVTDRASTSEAPSNTESIDPRTAKVQSMLESLRGQIAAKGTEHLENMIAIEKTATNFVKERFPNNPNSRFIETNVTALALKAYKKSLPKGNAIALMDALDTATKWKEQGRVGDRQRYTDDQMRMIANGHVMDVLKQYESMTNDKLFRAKAIDKLTSPAIERQIALSNDKALINRFNELKTRAANATPSNPVRALTQSLNGVELTPGDLTQGDIRQRLAEVARREEQRVASLETASARMEKYSIQDSLRVMDDMENGRFSAMAPEDRTAMQTMRELIDSRRDAIHDLGTGKFDQYIENYFPHLWANVGKMRSFLSRVMGSKAPLQGPASFLKPRYYDTILEGVQAGLEPLTYNPIKMGLLRLHEMDRYLAAHQILNDLKTRGFAKLVPYGKEFHAIPDGWVQLNDQIFRTIDEHGQAGRYYAPPDAAKPINNHLSPGLRGNMVYDVIRKYSNAVNMSTLSLSAFHATETALNAVVTETGLGFENLMRGNVSKGLGAVARGLTLYGPVKAYWQLGKLGMEEYLNPGTHDWLTKAVDAVESGGGRIGQDPFYKNNAVENLGKSLKQLKSATTGKAKSAAIAKTAMSVTGALLEKIASPMMGTLVPRLKLGAALRLASDVLERMPDAHPDVIRHEMDKVVDSIDNRFGQVTYDNMFMNKVSKDLGMIAFRSLGWNLGTAREIGGGFKDVGKAVIDKVQGKQPQLTLRMGHTIALPIVTAWVSTLLQYSMTGKAPQSATDFFYPQTGNIGTNGKPERVYIKTYMTDVFGFAKHPADTVVHKLSPWLSQGYDMVYRNSDYYGVEIRHKEDPVPQQVADLAKYWLKSVQPFSIQNIQERMRQGEVGWKALSAIGGILPAPMGVGQSPAEELSFDYSVRHMPKGPYTKQEFDRQQTMRQYENQLASGNMSFNDLSKAAQSGKISWDDVDKVMDAKNLAPLERQFSRLSSDQALEVYGKANPQEKERLRNMLFDKWDNIDPNDKDLNEKFRTAISGK